MNRTGHTCAVALAFSLAVTVSLGARPLPAQQVNPAETEQAAIARRLLGADATQRSDAFTEAARLEPASIENELRIALISLLQSEADARAARAVAAQRGQPLVALPNGGEFIGGVAKAVAGLRDPRAIPALTAALGTGYTVISALVGFGEAAAPAVLAVADSPDSRTSVVNDALRTLALMVDSSRARPLSPASLAAAERVAERRLSEPQRSLTITWAALDLAARFPDAKLRTLVESLATNPAEAIARGASDSGLVEQTRKRAAAALARPAQPVPTRHPPD